MTRLLLVVSGEEAMNSRLSVVRNNFVGLQESLMNERMGSYVYTVAVYIYYIAKEYWILILPID